MNAQDLPTATIDFLLASTTQAQRKQMLIACADGNDIDGLQKLITAEPAIVRAAGEDALAAACAKGHLAVAQRLHALGVKVDGFLFDDSNPAVTIAQYPMHCALENSRWEVAQWLIACGAKVMHMPRVLGNMVNAAPVLFRHMLHELPYIASLEKPAELRTGMDEKAMADALLAALEAIAHNEYADDAAIALQEGLPAHTLYDVAMKKHAYAILRDLYERGYRPDAAQKAAHLALLEEAGADNMRAARVRELMQAWVHADNHQVLDAQTLAHSCRVLAAQSLHSAEGAQAAFALTRSGAFLRVVAPLLPQAGINLLQAQDEHGATLAEVLAVRGELAQAFDPAAWRGDFALAAAMHGQLPQHLQAQVDLGRVRSAFGRHRIGTPMPCFKLAPAGGSNGA